MDYLKIVEQPIGLGELKEIASQQFGDFVKAVVDLEKGIMVIGTELHADAEAFLLEHDSKQDNLWGINLFPDKTGEEFVEYDSMINIRPRQGNRSRGVEDPSIRQKIRAVVDRLVTY